MSIRNKIILSIVLSVFFAVAGCSVMVFWQSSHNEVRNFNTNTSDKLHLAGDYMTQLFANAKGVTQVISELPNVRAANGHITSYVDTTESVKPIGAELSGLERDLFFQFALFSNVFPAYELIYLGTDDGGFVQMPDDPLGAGYDPRTRPWFIEAKAAGRQTILTDPYLSDNGNLVYTVARAVYDNNDQFFGVVGIDINLKELTAFLDTIPLGETGCLIMTESNGLILYDPTSSDRLFKNIKELGNAELSALFTMGDGTGEVTVDGTPYVAVAHSTPDGWHLITLITRSELMRNAMNTVFSIMAVGLGLIIVLAIAGLFVSRSIVAPIKQMAAAAAKVADGDFEALPRHVIFKGELAHLHLSMVSMIEQLAQFISTARSKTAEAETALEQGRQALVEAENAKHQADRARRDGVGQTASQLEGVVNNLGRASLELEQKTGLVTSSVDIQLARTAETATAMEQMNVAVGEVARNSSQAAELAEQARHESMAGRQSVIDVVSSISQVEKYTNDMSQSMGKLAQQAEDIGQIMNVITDIADQTNLLALNAAIEAARAGEYGRGFAVVADEVRKLAEKTMGATKSVGEAIHGIQQGAENNNQLIRQSVEQVQLSTSLAEKAGEALSRIESMVATTADQVRIIATASEEQSATSEQVAQHTEDVNLIANDVAHAMQQANTNMQELARLTTQLQSIIQSLKEESRG